MWDIAFVILQRQNVSDTSETYVHLLQQTAVTALARKLAIIVWNMINKNQNYNPPTQYLFIDEKRKLEIVNRIKKQINKFDLTNQDLGFVTI